MTTAVARLKHVAAVNGRVGWHGLSTDDYRSEGDYLVTGTEFVRGGIDWSTCHRVSREIWLRDPNIQLAPGDVLVTKDGSVGKTAMVADLPGLATLNSGIFRVRPEPSRMDGRFLYWCFQSGHFERFMDLLSTGSTINHLYQRDFVEFVLPLPPLDVQERIADFLDDQTARIDHIITARQRQAELLSDQYEAAVESSVLPRVDTPRRAFKPGHLAVAGSAAYTPPHWKLTRLKAILEPREERRGVRRLAMLSLSSRGFLYPRGGEADRQQASSETISRNLVVQVGDLVINPMWLTGGAVAVSQLEGTVSPDYRVFRIRSEDHPRFVHHLMRTRPYLDQYRLYTRAETTFDRRVRQDDLDSLPMVLPPYEEQLNIVALLDEINIGIEEQRVGVSELLDSYSELKRSLISAAVAGEFDVSSADGSRVVV